MSKSYQYYRSKRNQIARILKEETGVENDKCYDISEKILLKFGYGKPSNLPKPQI